MPTVIDRLVLELGLDPSSMSAGQRKALESLRGFETDAIASGRRIESEVKRVGNVLSDFRRTAVGVFGLVFGGGLVKNFIDSVTTLDAATGRLGVSIGMSGREISNFQGMIKQVGGSAESANAIMSGLNGEIVRFALTGQAASTGVLSRLGTGFHDMNGKLKTSYGLFADLASVIESAIKRGEMTEREATGFLSMIPGMNQDGINLILKGTAAIRELRKAAEDANTAFDSEKAEQYQKSVTKLSMSWANLAKTIVNVATPAISKFFDALSWGLDSLEDTPERRAQRDDELKKSRGGKSYHSAVGDRFGKPPSWLQRFFGISPEEESPEPSPQPAPQPGASSVVRKAPPTVKMMTDYILSAAQKRGIDPNVALEVAKREGLYAYLKSPTGRSFVPGEPSYGPFQLYYGGGLGNEFTKKTGLHASNSDTWEKQVDFSLDKALQVGWTPWYGWRGDRWAGIPRFGATAGGDMSRSSSKTTTVNIANVDVNAPSAKDAAGIAREIGTALDNTMKASSANWNF